MSRPIDSENLYKFLTDQRVKERGAYSKGVNTGLDIARSALRNEQIAPTLTPQNEALTLEEVAEILAEQLGDECACNVNGNDEWLPMMCHYGDVCPDPPEHLGCWMELLRNKYRRPPERQGGDADHG